MCRTSVHHIAHTLVISLWNPRWSTRDALSFWCSEWCVQLLKTSQQQKHFLNRCKQSHANT